LILADEVEFAFLFAAFSAAPRALKVSCSGRRGVCSG
jgi:hypothetical protein